MVCVLAFFCPGRYFDRKYDRCLGKSALFIKITTFRNNITKVGSGSLTVCLENKRFTVNEGEVIHFIADKPHYYCNETRKLAKAFVLMFYSK
ncbi:cupin domain-containing protein [Clostridium sp. DJ247]|uniref:cupin domain-containing protein n=1 Tax=Clostridium sp. DJ247 TaxID=2726188 RepID=UPI0016232FAB|nr:cupin domain-containing protein [Clostridium sp. DJ247]MBC2579057.1 cupin domain-containing protein [Clostridium sp. DJ247]